MIIDLSEAEFFAAANLPNAPFGQYVDGVIASVSTGWPDWRFLIKFDPTVTYTIRYKYDAASPHDHGGRGFWVTGLRVGHVYEDWNAADHFAEIYNNTGSPVDPTDVTITVGPGINTGTHGGWDGSLGPASGYVLPYFESHKDGALSYLEITPDPIVTDPVPWPEEMPLVSGQNLADPAVDAGSARPYHSRYWVYTPSEDQTLDLDTFGSTASDLPNADTQIWIGVGDDFDLPQWLNYNDDADSPPDSDHGLLSSLSIDVVTGTKYRIKVGTYGTDGDGITQFDLNAPFTGTNLVGGGGGGGHDPDPPDPNAAYFLTEIVSTLLPASGKIVASYAWTQVSPSTPVVALSPDHQTLRFKNPAVLADTDFVFRLTITDNLGATQTEDHTVHVKAHDHWALRSGGVHGIETVRGLAHRYTQVSDSRSPDDLLSPYANVYVYDEDGWLATYTTGARSVLLRRTDDPPALTAVDSGAGTFTPTARLLLLPAPFDGTVDEVLLDEMISSAAMDLYDRIYAMVNENVTTVNGVQIYGPNAYDAAADFNDYLGLTFAGDAPDLTKTGKISAEGFVRLIFGPAGLELAGVPASMVQQSLPGAPGVQVIDPESYAPSDHMLESLQMGDVLGLHSPNQNGPTHVGIYLGLDSHGKRRFVSCRPDVNGVSAADAGVVVSTVHGYGPPTATYSSWLRSARRY